MLARLYHARSRASVGCGGRLNGVSEARQHLVRAGKPNDRASCRRSALADGHFSSRRCCPVARKHCGDVSICPPGFPLVEERLRGLGLSSKLVDFVEPLGFLAGFVDRQGKSSRRAKDYKYRKVVLCFFWCVSGFGAFFVFIFL